MRLAPQFGGDPRLVVFVSIGNDTGSDLQTLYPAELRILRFDPQRYQGFVGRTLIDTANGTVMRDLVLVEIMALKEDGVTSLTDWLLEKAVIMPEEFRVGSQRLSGGNIRRHLYSATAPGNHQLFVSQKKERHCISAPSSLVWAAAIIKSYNSLPSRS